MTKSFLYAALTLVVLVTPGVAFRRNLASFAKLEGDSVYAAEPPDVTGMKSEADLVIDKKIKDAEDQLALAQKSLMNLSTAVAGSNNTNKGMTMHECVDSMMAANVAKAAAIAVKEKVHLMVEACSTLFTAVKSFKTNSEPRAALQKEKITALKDAQIQELKEKVVETEKLDLTNLLTLVAEIRDLQAQVETLDGKVGAGAAPGIVGASQLVYHFATQLKARQDTVSTANALNKMAPLDPEKAQLKIEPQFTQSLEAASAKIQEIIDEQTRLIADAQAQLMVVAGSVKQSNATRMHELIDSMMAANQAKAQAEALDALIEKAIQPIIEFFTMLAGYSARDVEKKIISGKIDDIDDGHDEIHKAEDAAILLEVGSFLQFYQLMWIQAMRATALIPEGDAEFRMVSFGIDENSVAVHEWLNNEMSTLCEYYKSCKLARDALIAQLAQETSWCDERFTLSYCKYGNKDEEQTKGDLPDGGSMDMVQPNGKMCDWTKPDNDAGIRGECKQINPPTNDLKFGKNDPEGVGIFY